MKHFKLLKTAILMVPFLLWGITLSIEWSTFPEMRLRLDTDLKHVAYAISIGTAGGLFGGPVASVADRFSKYADLLLAASLIAVAGSFMLYPFSCCLWLFALIHFTFVFGWSLYQAGAHSEVTRLWGEDGQPVRIALHFLFPVGAMIGPLILIPFLADDSEISASGVKCTDVDNTTADFNMSGSYRQSLASPVYVRNCSEDGSLADLTKPIEDTSSIEIAYLIVGSVCIIIALMFLFLHCCAKCLPRLSYIPKNRRNKVEFNSFRQVFSPKDWADGDGFYGAMIFIFMNIYFILELGTMQGTQEYLVTYAVDSGHFQSREAVVLNSVLFATGAFGRLVAMIVNRYISAPYLLMIGVHGQFLLNLLCLLIGTKSRVNLWILAPILGFFREPMYPMIFSWTDHYIILLGVAVGLTDMIGRLFDILLIVLQGYLYDNTVIESIFYTSVAYGFVQCLVVYVMTYFASRKGGRKNRRLQDTDKPIDQTQNELL